MPQANKQIFAIIGSTRENSSNENIVKHLAKHFSANCDIEIFNAIASLPHFNPDIDQGLVPESVIAFRQKIEAADGVIICTPEYVFSLPGALKNAIEWTVSTTVFTDKPLALITAAASGEKAHESIQLIMGTLMGKFVSETCLLIKGVKGKVNSNKGEITDDVTEDLLNRTMQSFLKSMDE